MNAMQSGLRTMQKEYKKLDIDKIDTLQDEMAEMLDMNSEIQDALSRQYDSPEACLYIFYMTFKNSSSMEMGDERWEGRFLSNVTL